MSLHPDVVRSLRRSRTRARLLQVLARRRMAYVGELAAACGVTHERAAAALTGRAPAFRRDLSPVRLGLVRIADLPTGVAFAITPAGDRAAAWLVEWAAPGAAGATPEPRTGGLAGERTGGASPVSSSHATWSVTCAAPSVAPPRNPVATKGI